MGGQDLKDEFRHLEEQMGIHLLMVCMASVLSAVLICFTFMMSWELWTIPLIMAGILTVWCFHIGRFISEQTYEYLCAGFMIIECFYFGVHQESFTSLPVLICLLFLVLILLEKKFLIYLVEAVYLITFLYHFILLRTAREVVIQWDFARFGIGLLGTVGAMIFSLFIIDRRREVQEEVQELAKQAALARQQNADFLSNVSHELRTPINMVTGISEVELGKELPPELEESMCSIQMAGKRLAGQINDILDYTEIAGNTLVVTNEKYMPASIINDIVTMASMLERNSELEMIFDLDTALPSLLVGDAEKISRVLWIVTQNAIKFTEAGGVYVHMGFRRESYGINLNITIEDTGMGMTSSQLSRLYDDFYQADSGCSRCAGGLGLGIPIAHGLLSAMGGFIHYDSGEGQGTKVHISIPQTVADELPCMTVPNAKKLCIACYFKQDKYECSQVREYYDRMILHLAEGLGVQAYHVYSMEELDRIMRGHEITHLFLAQEEYEEDAVYFKELGKKICIAMIVKSGFLADTDTNIRILQKPFFGLPIVNLLNGMTHGVNLGDSMQDDRAFTCTGVRALVVDDEEMNLVVAKGILSRYGMQIDTCLNGAAAVEQTMGTSYGLIFLDHMMPGMDGVETLKRIRALRDGAYQNLPIVALTANAISGAREMFKNEGFTEFVPKPIERPVLERALRKILPEECIQYEAAEEPDLQWEEPGGQEDIEIPQEESGTETQGKTVETEEVMAESLSVMERLQRMGIDVELGLDYCAGAEDFYLEMLQMYCDQKEEKSQEIASLYENGDWGAYAVKVHALKSTSLTIGAKELSEQAKALEQAGKSGDESFIREHHESLMHVYEAVCAGISVSIQEAGAEGGGTL